MQLKFLCIAPIQHIQHTITMLVLLLLAHFSLQLTKD